MGRILVVLKKLIDSFSVGNVLKIGIPVAIVSERLGHSSMKITQEYYGKVVQKRVSEEIIRLMKK